MQSCSILSQIESVEDFIVYIDTAASKPARGCLSDAAGTPEWAIRFAFQMTQYCCHRYSQISNLLNETTCTTARPFLHCKYIGRKYYDILSCLIYHRNFVVFFTVDGWVQPLVAAVFDYRHRQQVVLCINQGICYFLKCNFNYEYIVHSTIFCCTLYNVHILNLSYVQQGV